MERSKIDRINELAKLAKERALTEDETAERDKLRKEYIALFKGNMRATLDSTRVQNPDGSIRKLNKK